MITREDYHLEKNMELIIRADASPRIGTGHVMRCLALAQAWQSSRGTVRFISCCQSHTLRDLILEHGFELIEIDRPYPHKSDLPATNKVIDSISSNTESDSPWVVLDGYHFDPLYQKTIHDTGARVIVIDDYVANSSYHADILLNQNITANAQAYSCDSETLLLLGTKYVLLREEFLRRKKKGPLARKTAKKILVTLGGSDPDNVTLKVVRALKQLDIEAVEAKIVVGPASLYLSSVREEVEKGRYPGSISLIHNADMPDLMNWADIALCGGGITCLELVFMGVPCLVFTLAENQKNIGAGLQAAGAAIDLGWPEQIDVGRLAKDIKKLMMNSDLQKKMSTAAENLVDGQGAQRVAFLMAWLSQEKDAQGVNIREARLEDCEQIWLLSNSTGVRENSFNPEPIELESHITWYEKKLASADVAFYVSDLQGVLGGQVRYDKIKDAAEISFSVAPAFRGRGMGKTLIRDTIGQACERLNVGRVFGLVREFNHASIHTFLGSGFQRVCEQEINNCKCIRFERSWSRDYTEA